MKKIFECFFNLLCQPFKIEFKWFITLFVISSLVDIVVYTFTASLYKAIFIGLHHYVFCYLLTLILCFLPTRCKLIYKVLILFLMMVNFIIDFVCIYSFHTCFSEQMVSVFSNTNWNELVEFINTYMSPLVIILIFCSIGLIYFLYHYILRFILPLGYKGAIVGLLLCVLSITSIIFISTKNIGNISLVKFYSILKDTTPDLKRYMLNPDIDFVSENRCKNLVLIIGESFSKSHSSLYGYEKETNPYLSSLRDSSLLYVFNSINSPALNTVPSFKAIMSTYKPEFRDSVEWFKCQTLHEILHKAGYKIYWYSNQNKKGLWNNVVTEYALLSDQVVFYGEKFAVKDKEELDGGLITLIDKSIKTSSEDLYKTYFIHLMGSHYEFNRRYPQNFEKFRSSDYLHKNVSQRKLLADYDNSILYNDSVVYEIMNLYKDKETIIFYFPDHALDAFESRDDYIGHAIMGDKESMKYGSSIPFFVYMSPLFQQHFPDLKERIIQNIDTSFRTDDMIYTIMDIIGIKFHENEDVSKYSLFK